MKIEKLDNETFRFTFTKTIKDINGNDIEVVDHYEEATLLQLQQESEDIEYRLGRLLEEYNNAKTRIEAEKDVNAEKIQMANIFYGGKVYD